MSANILLVEDDEDFGMMLKQYLELSGLQVTWFTHSQEVETLLEKGFDFHLAIFDVMMPYMSGFALAQHVVLKYPFFPFVFLTAKDQKIDKLTGLKIGACDYITKPCDPEELVLRIQNIIHRSYQSLQTDKINIGTYLFDRSHLWLTHGNHRFRLTEREADLLTFLWNHNGQLVTREQILAYVWGGVDFFAGRSMDVFISRLRKYFIYDPQIKIHSVRGVGFDIQFSSAPLSTKNT